MEDIAFILHPILRAVDLAHRRGEIADRAKMPEDIRQAAGIASAQAIVAVIVGILPAEEGDAAWRADGVLRDGVIEAAAFARHAVQMRCLHIGMTLVSQHFGVVLVSDDEEDVGTATHNGLVQEFFIGFATYGEL